MLHVLQPFRVHPPKFHKIQLDSCLSDVWHVTWLLCSMRYSCSGVHLSRTGSRISNGTPPTSAIAERAERHRQGGITLFVHVHAQLQTVDMFLFDNTKSSWVEFRQGPHLSRYWLWKTVETFCCTFILCCELWSPGTYTDHHSEWRAKQ